MKTPPHLKKYFKNILTECDTFYNYAQKAKKTQKKDSIVHTKIAHTMAERVVGLLSSMYPSIVDTKIVASLQQLEKKYGFLDWRVAFFIALEVAQQQHMQFEDEKEAILCGVRVGFAYLTGGIVSSPLEGLVDIQLVERKDGKGKFFRLLYGGPIRNAGGTAAALSALVADFVRQQMGYAVYDPDNKEVERVIEEVFVYNTEVTNLQYTPSVEEIRYFVEHIPVEISGDATHKQEVKINRDLSRILTNRIRSGMCLLVAECLLLKAPKLLKGLIHINAGMKSWEFLEDFCVLQKKMRAKNIQAQQGFLAPDYTFIKDLTMGRPVFALPCAVGGFRLRYGRSRFSGFSAVGVHPATMILVDEFIATGTQLRIERPLKSTITMPCDHIMGPIVKLKNGDVEYVHSKKDALMLKDNVDEILFLGDILISYGDFLDRGHQLIPPGYCEEWWFEEFKTKIGEDINDIATLQKKYNISKDFFKQLIDDPINSKITPHIALRLSKKLGIPLHPQYVYFWSLLSMDEFKKFLLEFSKAKLVEGRLSFDKNVKGIFEKIGIPHKNVEDIVVSLEHTSALLGMFGVEGPEKISLSIQGENVLSTLNTLTSVVIKDKKGIFIGARMGRPEKAKARYKAGAVHGLTLYTDMSEQIQKFLSQTTRAQTQHIKGQQGEELWQKGALRAQYNLFVNKDGTLRYDATEAPVTHIRPSEAGVSFRDFRKLGYKQDIFGNELAFDEQIVELFPQDVILPCCPDSKNEQCDDYLFLATKFIDAELEHVYGAEPIYNLTSKKQLLGQYVVGLAPHTSTGCVLRIVGFSKTQTFLCHPYMHSAMRRDCDGDESSFLLLMDVFLNFNPAFLPDRRGSKMDAPFVITPLVEPKEVDDMVFNLDIVDHYDLAFYEAAVAMKNPWEMDVKTIRCVLNTEHQFSGTWYTHENGSLDDAVMVSLYKRLETMRELVFAQLAVGEKIRAVDTNEVASLILKRHVLKDITKNLDKFFVQEYRCILCRRQLRRPLMNGQCPSCGGNAVPTIHIASVVKYKDILIELVEKYKLETNVRLQCEQLLLRLRSLCI